jgi:hypothetical protein
MEGKPVIALDKLRFIRGTNEDNVWTNERDRFRAALAAIELVKKKLEAVCD